MSLRSNLLRIASELPQGNQNRKKILAILKKSKPERSAADASIDREIQAFANEVQKMVDRHDKKVFEESGLWQQAMDQGALHYRNITLTWGRRYAKLVQENYAGGGSRQVFCFVDRTNGDILKAASWKKPAKHARGNVMDRAQRGRSVGPYGANYLRA